MGIFWNSIIENEKVILTIYFDIGLTDWNYWWKWNE